MGGRTKVRLSFWLISVLVIFCRDTEAEDEVTTPSPTTTPPPMEPIALYGANTDKDNLKGKVPWRIMPFKTDKDKYKPYIIYPAPNQWYPPKFGKPNDYVDKDWDPPKKKDDIKHKKKPKELDDVPKPKTDKHKTIDDMLSDRNKIMQFLSMPGYATKCLDGDKKFLDDKSECKRMKKNLGRAWAAQEPPMGSNYYPPRRPPWQSNSFVGEPIFFKPSRPLQPFETPESMYPNYYPLYQTPDGLIYPYVPDGYIDPYAPVGSANPFSPIGSANPFQPLVPTNAYPPPVPTNPFAPPGPTNPFAPPVPANLFPPVGPTNTLTPIKPVNPRYYVLLKGSKLPSYSFPYRYPNTYNRFFADVNTGSPKEEPEAKKLEPVTELLKDKPEQKEEKPTSTAEPKNLTKDLTFVPTNTPFPILP